MKQLTGILKQRLLPYAAMLLSSLIVPFLGYSQTPPPPTGGTGGGGSPDNTPLGGVPFDWRLNLLLVAAGIVFAFIVMKKIQKERRLQKGWT